MEYFIFFFHTESSNFSVYFTFIAHHNQNEKFSLEVLNINLYFIKLIVEKIDSYT